MQIGDLVKYKFSHDNEGNEEPSKPMVVLEVSERHVVGLGKRLIRCYDPKNQGDHWFDEDTLEVVCK